MPDQRRGLFPQLELHILSFICEYLHMDVHSRTGHLAPVCEASQALTHTADLKDIVIYEHLWLCVYFRDYDELNIM